MGQQMRDCSKTVSGDQILSLSPTQLESLFVKALVHACSCRDARATIAHRKPHSSYARHERRAYGRSQVPYTTVRSFHVFRPCRAYSFGYPNQITRDEYRKLIDNYREPEESSPRSPEYSVPPSIDHSRDIFVTEAESGPAEDLNALANDPAVDRVIELIENEASDTDELFHSYKTLPFPGVAHLGNLHRRTLLHRLSVMKKKTEAAALRYLSVVDDMKAAGLEINRAEWNSAVHLVGRCFATVTDAEVEVSIKTWKEMEQDANVQGGNVTFNILFDIATKAGKFVLAEMILQEMRARRLRLSRFTRVGLIYYYGLKQDGSGVRKAYRELVEAGEIVDTTVLNCVIASLLRAGELQAAENVYARMKRAHTHHTGHWLPNFDWKKERSLGRLLDRAVRSYRENPERLKALQDEQSLAPNARTYIIFLTHHVSVTGELQRVAGLLDEMQASHIPAQGRVFMELFRGFAEHGGVRYTSWTKARLEEVWRSYKEFVDHSNEEIYVGKWMVIWAIKAFARCCGQGQTMEIWEELKSRWRLDPRERNIVVVVLRRALEAHG